MLNESTSRDYQAISDMPQIQPVSKFLVVLSGKTNNTHEDIVQMIQNSGHVKVQTPEDCDYCLLFCPITSRVETQVDSSLRLLTAEKPAILVVMYHTFNPDYVTPENHRLGVVDPRVRLTVSYLFHEQRLLRCNHNDIARFELRKYLGLPQESWSIPRYRENNPLKFWLILLVFVVVVCLIILMLILLLK
ncbi:uncharacterized protein [Paralichthys olivaceus]|uniref:uncharacterized protein isoform X4 n=1 Tax=Paralichthys olivaceus TaxID=8255 RepID=UPI00375177DD